jgi:hypothetical protein
LRFGITVGKCFNVVLEKKKNSNEEIYEFLELFGVAECFVGGNEFE